MSLITRDQVRPVVVPTETLHVAAIGGEVLVRGMDLPQLMAFNAARRAAQVPREGEDAEAAAERASAELVPLLLSMCVLAGDELPVYTLPQWRAFAAAHPAATVELFQAALRVSGQAPDDIPKP